MDGPKLFNEGFISEMRKVFREEFNPLHERLEKVENKQFKFSHNDPNGRRRIHPRKYRIEDDWDPGIVNRGHGGKLREGRVREENLDIIKKNTPLNDPEAWSKLEKMMEAYLEFNMMGSVESSPNASSCAPNQLKEEEKQAISKSPLENKPETDGIEEIEVMAEEGELWVEGLIPSLQEEEDEEVLVQVEEPQVQALPTMGVDENEFFTKPRDDVRAKLKIDNVEHIDFIGVDRFDVHPNFLLIDFFNKLRRIALQHGLNFEEFCFAKSVKHRKYSKYLFSWHGRFELFQFELRMKREKYSKYLFYWHGRYQASK